MASLTTKIIMYLGRKPDFINEVRVNDEVGHTPRIYIKEWNADDKPEPTQEQLDAVEDEANTYEANQSVDAERQASYGTWREQLDEIYHNIDTWKTRIKSIKDNKPHQ
jgi:hypothetical protein